MMRTLQNNKNAIKANDRVLKNHEERIDKLEHQASNTLTNLKADIKQLDGRINKVGASAAALADYIQWNLTKMINLAHL